MPSERESTSKMLTKCDTHAKYTGKKRPTCDSGKGCQACWSKHRGYLRSHPAKVTGAFQEFSTWVSQQKRLLQIGKINWPLNATIYDVFAMLEKTIRSGAYRVESSIQAQTLEEIDRNRRKRPR
jgi:hypothetical protein